MAFILPHSITLPGGYRIQIKYIPAKKIKFGGQSAYGWWESDSRRIFINKDEPIWMQIHILGHELIHAANDYAHWLEETIVTPMKIEVGETLDALDEDDE